jgi:hypothetical protein
MHPFLNTRTRTRAHTHTSVLRTCIYSCTCANDTRLCTPTNALTRALTRAPLPRVPPHPLTRNCATHTRVRAPTITFILRGGRTPGRRAGSDCTVSIFVVLTCVFVWGLNNIEVWCAQLYMDWTFHKPLPFGPRRRLLKTAAGRWRTPPTGSRRIRWGPCRLLFAPCS